MDNVWVCEHCGCRIAIRSAKPTVIKVCPRCGRPASVPNAFPRGEESRESFSPLVTESFPGKSRLLQKRQRLRTYFQTRRPAFWMVVGAVLLGVATIGWWFLGQFPDFTQKGAPQRPPPARPSGETKPPPLEWTSRQVFVAKTLDQVKQAVVKIEIPLEGDGAIETGTGFFIDQRGWIATNDHLVQHMNNRSYVRSADGQTYRIAGVVAQAPAMDLAIIQLAERPVKMMILDLSYTDTPYLGTEVYAFGHPYNVDFSLSRGVVSRVLTTAELVENFPDHIVTKIHSPPAMIWIQHDAKISPGNSGGPLLDGSGRVIGVNTFVHKLAQYGFASHIRYLRELAKGASGTLQPLPEPAPPPLEGVTSESLVDLRQIGPLFKFAESIAWTPEDLEQYEKLAEWARIANIVKIIQVQGKVPAGVPPSVIDQAATEADALFRTLTPNSISRESQSRLNSWASQAGFQPHAGIIFAGRFVAEPSPGILLLEFAEQSSHVLVRLRPDYPELPRNSPVFVAGLVSPQAAEIRIGQDVRQERVPVVWGMFVMSLANSHETRASSDLP